MPRRAPNPCRVKIHRSYTVEEAATACNTHRNTVRHWIKAGLETIDERRPVVILGRTLREFLRNRRTRNKRPCGPGRLYCMRCRMPHVPAGNMVDYQAFTTTSGNLMGMCPVCHRMMYRRVSFAKIDEVTAKLEVTVVEAERHIVDTTSPSVNSDFNEGDHDHAEAQR